MSILDVFNQDPFKTIQLTTAVEKVPYVPDGLEAMGIFEDMPIRTDRLMVEQRAGQLTIVPFTDRGAPGTQRTTEKREARSFGVPRLRMEDTIFAREIQFIRQFGMETQVMEMQAEVARRLTGPTGIVNSLRYTQEFHRLAALQGKLLDADGTVKYDWYDQFGITANAVVPFDLAAKTAGSLRPRIAELTRAMKRKAQGAFTNSTKIVALCGDAFWDNFITHPDIVNTYLNWAAATELRGGTAFESYPFADVEWVNYRGSDDSFGVSSSLTASSATVTPAALTGISVGMNVSGPGLPANITVASIDSGAGTFALSSAYTGTTGTKTLTFGSGVALGGAGSIAIPSNKAIFFPKNAPGVFQRALAPADSIEWLGTLGKPQYIRMIPDRDRNEWMKVEVDAYPLHICTRPEVLFKGTMDSAAD